MKLWRPHSRDEKYNATWQHVRSGAISAARYKSFLVKSVSRPGRPVLHPSGISGRQIEPPSAHSSGQEAVHSWRIRDWKAGRRWLALWERHCKISGASTPRAVYTLVRVECSSKLSSCRPSRADHQNQPSPRQVHLLQADCNWSSLTSPLAAGNIPCKKPRSRPAGPRPHLLLLADPGREVMVYPDPAQV